MKKQHKQPLANSSVSAKDVKGKDSLVSITFSVRYLATSI